MIKSLNELMDECTIVAVVKQGYHLKDNKRVLRSLMDYCLSDYFSGVLSRCSVCKRVKIKGVYVDFPFKDVKFSVDGVCTSVSYTDGVCSSDCAIKGYGLSFDEASELFKN